MQTITIYTYIEVVIILCSTIHVLIWLFGNKMVLLQRPIEIIDQQVMSIKEILVFPMGKEVIC